MKEKSLFKFRAWDKRSQVMRDVEALNFYEGTYSWIIDDYVNIEQEWVDANLDNVIIMQSTGLKDKNGVEIFEGDILTTEQYPYQVEGEYNYHGVVEWDKESAGYIVVKYVVNPLISGISNGMADRFEGVDRFEVIGNVYKNPERLEAYA